MWETYSQHVRVPVEFLRLVRYVMAFICISDAGYNAENTYLPHLFLIFRSSNNKPINQFLFIEAISHIYISYFPYLVHYKFHRLFYREERNFNH